MDDTFIPQSKYVSCQFCIKNFGSVNEFISHLRTDHCTKEGGSFICRYGDNQVCNSLPVEGVNDTDYAQHIVKHHILPLHRNQTNRKCSTMSLFTDSTNNETWTLYSASQNLSAVLNNPAKTKQKDFFTKLWGDSFVEVTHVSNPSYLPNITKQHFEPYLKKTSKRLKRHSRINSDAKLTSENNNLLQHFPSLRILKPSEKISFNASEIPDVFLRTYFNLNSKNTFDVVFPHISTTVDTTQETHSKFKNISWNPTDFSASSKLLQEKLSHYLDIVEVQIAKQVASKADAFFHTMTSHDVLMEQLSQTITKVRTLREKIHNIKNNLVIDSLRILRGVRCRSNYALVLQKLKVMVTVYQTQPTVKLLLSTPDYVAALDLIYTTKDLLNNELAGILCFRHLSSELNEMINTIDTLMIEEFERYAISDLNRPMTESEVNVVDVDKLFCIILGMLRRECFSFTNSYVKESNATIKAVIKQNVLEVVSSSEFSNASGDSLSVDEQLKLLTIDEWIILLRNTANSIVYLLRRIKATRDVMLDAVSISAGKVSSSHGNTDEMLFRRNLMMTDNNSELFLDEENYNIMLKKLSAVLSLPCQYALERYSHLLSQKSLSEYQEPEDSKISSVGVPIISKTASNNWLSEQATQQQLKEISEYVETLCSSCETLCCIESAPKMLRSIFKSEVGKFMLRFHYERLTKISLILESESWNPADVSCEFQQLVDHIYEFGKFTTYKAEKEADISSKPPNSILFVGEEKFVVIGTVLLLINIVAEYCIRAEDITLSASSLLRYVTELLHSFNSRSCRLVLGGEAVSDKTGKKKITSANLAVLLRALQLLLWLVPKIQTHFAGLLPPGSNMSSIERTTDELKKHICDINAKLVSIVSQVIVAELRTWEAKPPVPSKAFQNISKYLYKFFGAISNILKENDLYNLYLNIDNTFKCILRDHISRMNIVNNGGPQHGLVTQELIFYIEDLKKVSALPRTELNLESMQSIWR